MYPQNESTDPEKKKGNNPMQTCCKSSISVSPLGVMSSTGYPNTSCIWQATLANIHTTSLSISKAGKAQLTEG